MLEQKLEFLKEVLDYTETTIVTPDEDGGKSYRILIEKREVLFQKMKVIDAEIAKLDKEVISSGKKEYAEILKDMKNVRIRLISMDKENTTIASKIMEKLKLNVKSTKTKTGFHKAYQPLYAAETGSRFDSKK